MTDISNLSLADLRNLQEQIKQELVDREAQEIQKAREQILAIAQSVGLPLEDLMAKTSKSGTKKGSSGPVAVRFQHPDDAGQQWTGRGRQPRWVKEWVEGGKSLDALRVS
jgi:DNA-binding protein H-NS